ncbi:hypothetical protein V1523DRAFT_429516 [Lipomyces doorenjongii]
MSHEKQSTLIGATGFSAKESDTTSEKKEAYITTELVVGETDEFKYTAEEKEKIF